MQRPDATEYDKYYSLYVNQVPEGDVMKILGDGARLTARTLDGIPIEWETYRYAPDKWSVREALGHVVDVERLFSYRALSIARRDPAALPLMDQDQWAAASNAGERTVVALLDDFARARASSLAIFESLAEDAWDKRGLASGCEFTVRSFPYILAGHEIHHRRVLEEKYLKALRGELSG